MTCTSCLDRLKCHSPTETKIALLTEGTVWPRVGSPILHAAGGKTQRFEMLRAEADCDMCAKLISVGARFLQPAD